LKENKFFLCYFEHVIKILNAFVSRNHVFEIAVVQHSHTNNSIDLKYDMQV